MVLSKIAVKNAIAAILLIVKATGALGNETNEVVQLIIGLQGSDAVPKAVNVMLLL